MYTHKKAVNPLYLVIILLSFLVYKVCFTYLIMFEQFIKFMPRERDLFPFLRRLYGFSLILNDARSDDGLNRRQKLVIVVNC